ncbi:hypothetical protein AAFF_G00369150 [Aldrovandia affinis]|uniref:Interleukin-6 n=1 Tax=Aldrovandia affinis TaxID=143900 RepID=A0AAD7SJ52_9TELE|nr:hypothetical protein AAFF_G00369150 [Aldrovandia affinis]
MPEHSSKEGRARTHKSAGMFQHLQGTWLLALLLAAVGQTSATIQQRVGCQKAATTHKPCVDLIQWFNLVRNVGEGIETSDDETILIRAPVLTSLNGTHYYGCILNEAFQFYDKVLEGQQSKGRNYTELRHFLGRLKTCLLRVPCPERCRTLNENAQNMQMKKVDNMRNITSRKLAILQIQKLQRAAEQLNEDVKTQEKAIIELKGLLFYLPNKEVTMKCQPK